MTYYRLDSVAPVLPPSGHYWIAPDAQVIGNVELCENSSIWFGVVARGDNERITIGDDSNVQDNSVLHTDLGFRLTIGRGCTIGHQVTLHGCTIGDNSLIGIGATVLNGAVIGKNCIIGAGALIGEKKVIPDNVLVIGMPGKITRSVDAAGEEMLRLSAEHYVANWKRYSKSLIKL